MAQGKSNYVPCFCYSNLIFFTFIGKLKSKLAESQLGAIVTHALVTDNGEYIVAAESGFVLYWKVNEEKVTFKEEQKNILQVMLYDNKRKSLFISRAKPQKVW